MVSPDQALRSYLKLLSSHRLLVCFWFAKIQSVCIIIDMAMVGLYARRAPGHYTLRASVDWQQHKPGASHVVDYPPMQLARDGRDGSGWYPVAALDIPRDGLPSLPQR